MQRCQSWSQVLAAKWPRLIMQLAQLRNIAKVLVPRVWKKMTVLNRATLQSSGPKSIKQNDHAQSCNLLSRATFLRSQASTIKGALVQKRKKIIATLGPQN